MSKKFSKEPLRGMKDYYPSDLREYNWIIDTLRDVAERYGYEEYETPQIEPIEIFAAKSSQELVNEQSFIVEKKKGERLILIPELTPSLARMVAKKSQELKKPIRWFCIPTCFRYKFYKKKRGINRYYLTDFGRSIFFQISYQIEENINAFQELSNTFKVFFNL